MSDYSELKRLAEAATPGPWRHGKNSDDIVADHPAGHDQDDRSLAYYGGHLVAESICGSNRDFIVAANPAAVLALIAENEELGRYLCTCRDCGGEGSIHTGDWHSYSPMEPPEPVMEKCGECDGTGLLGEIQDLYQVLTESDQLKAENEALRRQLETTQRAAGELAKNAERYEWLRAQHWDSSAICCVVDPKLCTKLGSYCPSLELLDQAVDAGLKMSKESPNG